MPKTPGELRVIAITVATLTLFVACLATLIFTSLKWLFS